ncbi:hypothetical protein DH2020_007998 [Rehmannia glutinosa]|uniref:Uncharacterized protein n=1 Tax=Rehmannia glutinosa TaxID=99300 RepID=A0ABR0TZQ8_REHGL
MSRCFPYPLPGYTLSRARNEALIESIKLQKEKESKKEKKDKRKEKKEKRKEKKEKKERRKEKKDETNQNLDKPDIVKGHIGQKDCSDTKDEFLHKGIEAETEQLERSSLTEEHARPVSLSVPSTSFDSTENSKKRKRHSSTVDDNHKHGKVTLIQLSLKKQNEFDRRPRNKISARYLDSQTLVEDLQLEIIWNRFVRLLGILRIQDACFYTGNLDWLFQDRNQDDQKIRAEKRRRCASDSFSCSRSSGLWPRAEYLHGIDTYALPFTVPY